MLSIVHMTVNDKPVEVAVETGELLVESYGADRCKEGMQCRRVRCMHSAY